MTASPRRRTLTTVLVFTCAVIVAVSLALSAWTFVRQSQAATVRTADEKARSITQVGQCFQQVKNTPQVLQILGLVNTQGQLIDTLATNSIIANTEAIKASPGDPLNPVRRDSLRRLQPARDQLRAGRPALTAFILRTAENAPTKKSCNDLAASLGVDPSKLDQP